MSEAIILDALGDQNIDFTNVSVPEIPQAQCTVAAMAVRNLGLDVVDIDEMIVEGERVAFEAGWHPPLALART